MACFLQREGSRGAAIAGSIASGARRGAVDDLELGKFGETFRGELGFIPVALPGVQ
ncbi:MAG: hypothetical protein ACREDC_10900 [Bradyrhizobium sp.]